ncbi:hypothetical protein VIGAN_05220800, partial [Vigna angularis var. angularis]
MGCLPFSPSTHLLLRNSTSWTLLLPKLLSVSLLLRVVCFMSPHALLDSPNVGRDLLLDQGRDTSQAQVNQLSN